MKALESDEWDIQSVSTVQDAHREFSDAHLYDLVLVEVDDLSDGRWKEALRLLAESAKPCDAIVCCRDGGEDQWANVLGAGAFDLITAPYHPAEVHRIVRQVLTDQSLHRLAHLKL